MYCQFNHGKRYQLFENYRIHKIFCNLEIIKPQFLLLFSARIPLTFVLAFYMNHVVSRWWETWKLIPWPDSIALKLNTFFPNLPGKVG